MALNFKPVSSSNTFNILTSLILIYVAYKVFKFLGLFNPPTNTTEGTSQQAVSQVEKDIDKWKKQGFKQTYNDANYLTFANIIYEGMKYSSISDDYDSVLDTCLKMNNNLDVALLFKAYGIRTRYNFGIPINEDDLFTALRDELGNEYFGFSQSKLDTINNDWKNKGIIYQI